MGYKVLSKQQWNSLPPYKKYQMRANTPDLYNYYQDKYVPKAEPVATKEIDTGAVKRSAPSSSANYTDQVIDGSTNPARSFHDFLNEHRGGLRNGDHGNPNPLLRILPALYNGNFTVGQALAILFSGSYSDLSQEAIDNATNDYLTPTDKAIEAISTVLGLPSSAVSDQILQHNVVADPDKALTDKNPYAEAAGPTQSQITGKASSNKIYDKEGNLVRLTYDGEVYRQDDSGDWVTQESQESTGDGGVTVLPGTLTTTEPDTSDETKVDPYIPYALPENEAVDVTELTEEQQTDIWEDIKEGLGKIPGAIGKVIFGPDGMPTNVDEWIEWVDETLQAQMGPDNLPFPIVITTNPTEGTWIDLKIPVNFDVNGNPIRIPLFDEDGNFVSSDELGKAWVDAKGQIFGPLGEIGEIFLDEDGNIKLDLGQLEEVLLGDLTLNPDGSLTGSTAGEILVGKWFFNPDSGEWEEEEEVDINKDTVDDDTVDDDTTTTDDDDLIGVFEDPDEDPTPPAKAPRGKLIVDKDGNPLRIIGTDGTNYVLDGDGQWVVAAVGDGDGGETVLPGTTTIPDDTVVIPPDDTVVVPPDDTVVVPPDDTVVVPPDDTVVIPPDDTVVVPPDDTVVVPPDDTVVVPPDDTVVVPPDDTVVVPPDDTVVVPPDDTVVVPPDDTVVVPPDDTVVIPPDDTVVVPPDEPVVIPPDEPGVIPPDDTVVIPPDEPVVIPPDEPVVIPPDEPGVIPPDDTVVIPPDEPVVIPPDEPVVIPPDDTVVIPPDEPGVIPPDDTVVIPPDEPVVIPPDDTVVIPPDEPGVIPPDEPVGDPEEPLVGATGPAGAGGAAGKDAARGGMMGGLSYNLPGFVGVQYQPKDYTVELDRIINESLFKGMI